MSSGIVMSIVGLLIVVAIVAFVTFAIVGVVCMMFCRGEYELEEEGDYTLILGAVYNEDGGVYCYKYQIIDNQEQDRMHQVVVSVIGFNTIEAAKAEGEQRVKSMNERRYHESNTERG